ncbi:MAG: XdhC family protein [Candidatus Bipolaricaulia bacterium]
MTIFKQVNRLLEESGDPLALATVVAVSGSTPQKVGARMIVRPDKSTIGTVGGGSVETLTTQEALHTLESDRAQFKAYVLDRGGNTGHECGGAMDIFIDVIHEPRPLFETVDDRVERGRTVGLVTIVSSDPRILGASMLVEHDGTITGSLGLGDERLEDQIRADALDAGSPSIRSYRTSNGELKAFLDVIPGIPDLIVAGGGHVGKPLIEIGQLMGFRTVLVDDRKEFANRDRFPTADEVICDRFDDAFARMELGESANVIVVTRNGTHDHQVLKEVLKSEAGYIGFVASSLKGRRAFERLAKEGFTELDWSRVSVPCGIDLGDTTPAEIAVSILAEIVNLRKGGSGKPLSDYNPHRLVIIKGVGELGIGIAHRLLNAGYHPLIVETAALSEEEVEIEEVRAVSVKDPAQAIAALLDGKIPVAVDPEGQFARILDSQVIVDTLGDKGTKIDDAPITVGVGPGFEAGVDVHAVVGAGGRVAYSGSLPSDEHRLSSGIEIGEETRTTVKTQIRTVTDRARAVAGGVLEALLALYKIS